LVAFASITQAQATRTWVSGVGDDANPCSRTAPCKTFAGAISKTAAGGEIDALDPGGYGAVTITKAITIDGTGTFASILNSGTSGVIVNAPNTSIVTLRGLSIQGARQSVSPGTNGIRFLAGKGLNVLDCIIQNESTAGIDINMTAPAAPSSVVHIENTIIKNCAGDGLTAITSASQVWVSIKNSSFVENGTGLHAKNNSRVFADSCSFSNNVNSGVFSDGAAGLAVADIANSSVFNNGGDGVTAQTNGAIARISNCDIHNNAGTGAKLARPESLTLSATTGSLTMVLMVASPAPLRESANKNLVFDHSSLRSHPVRRSPTDGMFFCQP
jgi:hypothetical protein